MEKLTKEVLMTLSKDELQEAVETLQLKLEVAEKEKEALKELAEIGKKYFEYLKTEALRLVRAVEGEKAPILKLLEKADVDTLKSIVDEYQIKAQEKFRASADPVTHREEEEKYTPEWLMKASYKEILEFRKTLKEV